jgi:hypothetical protein
MYLSSAIIGIIFVFAAEKARTKRATWLPKRQMIGAKIIFIAVTALAGSIICFFGVGLLLAAINASVSPIRFSGIMSFNMFIASSLSVGATVGALLGYLFYKRSKFSKISYYDPFA